VLQKQLGRRIAELRRSRGLTQEQFAEALRWSVEFVSLVERGINSPSVARLEAVAKTLRVRVRDLFDFAERKK
jgi:transcriptional regulator with XRE-family HTH domain